MWTELDTVVTLAARLRLRPLALPQGLLALRPPPGGEGGSAFGSGASRSGVAFRSASFELEDTVRAFVAADAAGGADTAIPPRCDGLHMPTFIFWLTYSHLHFYQEVCLRLPQPILHWHVPE